MLLDTLDTSGVWSIARGLARNIDVNASKATIEHTGKNGAPIDTEWTIKVMKA